MSINRHLLRGATAAVAILFAVSANASLMSGFDTPAKSSALEQTKQLFARKGADDKKKDDKGKRRGRGRDDGPNHAFILKLEDMQMARRGADDEPGHIRHGRGKDDKPGDDHGRRGRGKDDKTKDDKGKGRHGRGSDDRQGDDSRSRA